MVLAPELDLLASTRLVSPRRDELDLDIRKSSHTWQLGAGGEGKSGSEADGSRAERTDVRLEKLKKTMPRPRERGEGEQRYKSTRLSVWVRGSLPFYHVVGLDLSGLGLLVLTGSSRSSVSHTVERGVGWTR